MKAHDTLNEMKCVRTLVLSRHNEYPHMFEHTTCELVVYGSMMLPSRKTTRLRVTEHRATDVASSHHHTTPPFPEYLFIASQMFNNINVQCTDNNTHFCCHALRGKRVRITARGDFVISLTRNVYISTNARIHG